MDSRLFIIGLKTISLQYKFKTWNYFLLFEQL